MNEQEQKRQIQDALRVYLGLSFEDIEDDVAEQDWDSHDGVVDDSELTYGEHVNAVEAGTIDLSTLSLTDKVELLTHDTLNQLLIGEIALENAQELIATIQAVDMAINVGKDA